MSKRLPRFPLRFPKRWPLGLAAALLFLFFVSPYLLLFSEFGLGWGQLVGRAVPVSSLSGNENVFWPEFWWALKNSFWQSFFSATGASGFGLVLALGLNFVSARFPKLLWGLQAVLVAPVLLPPFFILLTFMSWMNPFPFGIPGIALLHVFLLSGLAAVMLRQMLNEKLGELSEVAEVLGAGRLLFARSAFALVRRELMAIFLFLFVWSFTSFSIPFVVGGGRGTTLEILIYERVRIAGDLSGAVLISCLQTLILGAFLWTQVSVSGLRARRAVVGRLLQSRVGLGLALVFATAFILPWLLLSGAGYGFIWETPGFLQTVGAALYQSLKYALWVSLGTLALLCGLVYLFEVPWFQRFFQVYFPASLALVGLAGLSLGVNFGVLYVVGLLLMFTPSLMRLGLDSARSSLREQIETGRMLGASGGLIYREILLPQLWSRICLLAGLAFLWTLGDFALAKFYFESGETLPLLIENLLSSYRVDPALSLGSVILAAGALGLFAFWRLGRVFDS